MNSRNIKLGFVTIALLNGSAAQAYIREYDPDTLQARTMVQGSLIGASWNGVKWVEVAPVVEEVPAELVSRPTTIKTVQFEMGGKQYQTRSNWDLLG